MFILTTQFSVILIYKSPNVLILKPLVTFYMRGAVQNSVSNSDTHIHYL